VSVARHRPRSSSPSVLWYRVHFWITGIYRSGSGSDPSPPHSSPPSLAPGGSDGDHGGSPRCVPDAPPTKKRQRERRGGRRHRAGRRNDDGVQRVDPTSAAGAPQHGAAEAALPLPLVPIASHHPAPTSPASTPVPRRAAAAACLSVHAVTVAGDGGAAQSSLSVGYGRHAQELSPTSIGSRHSLGDACSVVGPRHASPLPLSQGSPGPRPRPVVDATSDGSISSGAHGVAFDLTGNAKALRAAESLLSELRTAAVQRRDRPTSPTRSPLVTVPGDPVGPQTKAVLSPDPSSMLRSTDGPSSGQVGFQTPTCPRRPGTRGGLEAGSPRDDDGPAIQAQATNHPAAPVLDAGVPASTDAAELDALLQQFK
jgi:hypothetical protein